MNLSFLNPALLLGSLLALLPVLVHLLLRPRPRRTRFPALAILRPALLSGQRASRVRNVLLLVLRSALIIVVAVLLAGPTCTPHDPALLGREPVAAVFVLDESLSTQYRVPAQNATVREICIENAVEWAEQAQGWPRPSAVGLVWSGSPAVPVELSPNAASVIASLRSRAADVSSGRPLGEAISQAARMLAGAQVADRRIIVFTDLAASAWSDVSAARLEKVPGVAVHVIAPTGGQPSNLAIQSAEGPSRRHPDGVPVPLTVRVGATGFDGECWLVARTEDATLERLGPLTISTGQTRTWTMLLPPLEIGQHAVAVALEPADRLDFDQTRYIALQTGSRPAVWLLTTEAALREDDTSVLILSNLVSPEALDPSRQAVDLTVFTPGRLHDWFDETGQSDAARDPAVIVLFPAFPLSDAAQTGLQEVVERGATLLMLPDSHATDDRVDWPHFRAQLADDPAAIDRTASSTVILWRKESPFAGTAGAAEISRCGVDRRLRVSALRNDAFIHADYSDSQPAVVEVPAGRGRILLLTTSPDPAWSDLGVRAAGLLMWLHRLVDASAGAPGDVASFPAESTTNQAFASLPKTGQVQVSRVLPQSSEARKSTWIRLEDGRPAASWPTDDAGVYVARAAGGTATATFAVNWPEAESDLTPIDLPQLEAVLGTARVVVESPPQREPQRPAGLRRFVPADPGAILAAVLVGLFLIEQLYSNRPRKPAP